MKQLFFIALCSVVACITISSCTKPSLSKAEAEQQISQMINEYQTIAGETISKLKEIESPSDFAEKSKVILIDFESRMKEMEKYDNLEEILEKEYPDLFEKTDKKMAEITQDVQSEIASIIQNLCNGNVPAEELMKLLK